MMGLKIPEVNVTASGNLIEGYKRKFHGIEQNLKEDFTQVRNNSSLHLTTCTNVISYLDFLNWVFQYVIICLFFRLKRI